MSPERSGNRISLEEIVSNAKEIMLRDGYHVPVLIVETNKKLIVGQIKGLPPTHGERLALMRHLGQASLKTGQVDQLNQVFMVTEGWMSVSTKDRNSEERPSQDPKKKEVLIISGMQVQERKKFMKVIEVFRGVNKEVIRLEEFLPEEKKVTESVEIPLIEAFVEGFQMAFRIRYN